MMLAINAIIDGHGRWTAVLAIQGFRRHWRIARREPVAMLDDRNGGGAGRRRVNEADL